MKIIKGCCVWSLVAVVICFLALVGFKLNWNYGWLEQGYSTPISSPDEIYTAYVGERGFLDSVRCHLYVRKDHKRAERVMDIYGADIKWSPDSQRIAVVHQPYWDIYVYDIISRHKGQGYAESVHTMERSAPISKHIDWGWRDRNTILFYQSDDETHKYLTKVTVSDSTGKIILHDSKGKALIYH